MHDETESLRESDWRISRTVDEAKANYIDSDFVAIRENDREREECRCDHYLDENHFPDRYSEIQFHGFWSLVAFRLGLPEFYPIRMVRTSFAIWPSGRNSVAPKKDAMKMQKK